MKLRLKIFLAILLIFTTDVYGLAPTREDLVKSSLAVEISVLNFQVQVPQENRDVVDQLERLILKIKQLSDEVKLKDAEIKLLNEKASQHEKISNIQESQLQLYQQLLTKQEAAFQLLSSKVDNLDQIVKELKDANSKLEKKVITEKRIGNLKAILVGLLGLGLKLL